MIRGLALSVAQLGDPRIVRVLLLSLGLTLAIFAGGGGAAGWALDGWDPCMLAGYPACPIGALGGGAAAVVLTLVALWFVFPAVAIAVISLFSDGVVEAVEARHYPVAAARARSPGWVELARLGLASGGRLLVLNLIALPFYLLLLVTGVGAALVFLLVNAIALGRDLGDMVAVRHLDPAGRAAWRHATRARRFVLGLSVAALFLVPFLNLLAPVLGAAMATHLFHGSRE